MNRVLPLLLALAAVLALPAPAAAAPSSFRTGFSDWEAFQYRHEDRPAAVLHAREAGASVVRLFVGWDGIERTRPPSREQAVDPSFSGYDWRDLDRYVRDVRGGGLQVLLMIGTAPPWAEGPNRPPVSDDAPRGTWRPDPVAYGNFAEAAARRYSGTYPDPERPGQSLPRVRYWQGWNEPNLTNFLTPQWERTARGFRAVSPEIYRGLLNAFYAGVKRVARGNVVVTAGTAPFGDRPSGSRRIPPARFVRQLFCVEGRKRLRARRCAAGPVRFDVLAHHPYPIGPPRRTAINPDDVVVPDLGKLTRPLALAIRRGNVLPKRRKAIWATEISWDSSPPDPRGVPDRLRSRYINGAFNTLWRQGVSVMIWYLLRDEPEGDGYEFGLQSGLYLRGPSVAEDTPKFSLKGFRFPFTAYRKRGRAQLWGVAPSRTGRVVVEAQRGNRWRAVARLRPNRNRLFRGERSVRRGTKLRARQGDVTSDVWPVM